MVGVQVAQNGCEATNVCVVGSSRLMGDALARLLAALDHSITAWSAQPTTALSDPPEPHVVVLEVADLRGAAERAREIRTRWPGMRIVLVVREDSATAQQVASDIGASGCVSSRLGPAALAPAVMGALADRGLPAGRRRRPVPEPQMSTGGLDRPLSRLTPREGDVLGLLADGLTAEVIAGRLGVSSNTVRSHLQAVFSKLGVHSQLQAVAVAHRAGLTCHGSRFSDGSLTGRGNTTR